MICRVVSFVVMLVTDAAATAAPAAAAADADIDADAVKTAGAAGGSPDCVISGSCCGLLPVASRGVRCQCLGVSGFRSVQSC